MISQFSKNMFGCVKLILSQYYRDPDKKGQC